MNARVLTFLALVGCSQRQADDIEAAPPPDLPQQGGTTDSEGDGGGELVCREGLTACEGACVDLTLSDEHCGACGHACKEPSTFGGCRSGECPPAWFCGAAGRGFRSCDDVCSSHGQACYGGPRDAARGGCGGGYRLHYGESGQTALDLCEGNVGSFDGIEAVCSDAIDWSLRGGWNDVQAGAVACCCTQESPP